MERHLKPFLETIPKPGETKKPKNEGEVEGGREPELVAREFKWNLDFAEPEKVRIDLENFINQHRGFSLPVETLFQIYQETEKILESTWQELFPSGSHEAKLLIYHNLEHAIATGTWAGQIFLGALVKEGLIEKLPGEHLVPLLRTLYLVAFFHEIDDWWNREELVAGQSEEGKTAFKERFERVRAGLAKRLQEEGVSIFDFDRFLRLDDFRKLPKECVADARKMRPEDGFLGSYAGKTASLIDALPLTANEKEKLWEIIAISLQCADFLQIINPSYMRMVTIQVGEETLEKLWGPIALAQECSRVRPNVLEGWGWGNKEAIDWRNVGMSQGFFDLATSKIKPGLPYLEEFSSEKVGLINKRLGVIEQIVSSQSSG